MPTAAVKEKVSVLKPKELLSEQVIFRVTPALRRKLDRYVKKSGVRGIGEAVRHILETATWE